jgi:hypothetical protein
MNDTTTPSGDASGDAGPITTTTTAVTTVTARQGSQPHLGGVRVGIVDAATRDGVAKAKLLLRPASGGREVILTVGDTVDLGEAGRLTLVAVAAEGREEGIRPEVTLSLEAPAAPRTPPSTPRTAPR